MNLVRRSPQELAIAGALAAIATHPKSRTKLLQIWNSACATARDAKGALLNGFMVVMNQIAVVQSDADRTKLEIQAALRLGRPRHLSMREGFVWFAQARFGSKKLRAECRERVTYREPRTSKVISGAYYERAANSSKCRAGCGDCASVRLALAKPEFVMKCSVDVLMLPGRSFFLPAVGLNCRNYE
jgi:hypothetical protein